jgi:hypothetical protein
MDGLESRKSLPLLIRRRISHAIALATKQKQAQVLQRTINDQKLKTKYA